MKRAEHALLVTMLIAISLLACRIARGQEPDTALVLAQAFVAEAGFDAAADHAAMAHALQRLAAQQGLPLADMAVRYCAIWRTNTPRSRWVTSLRADAGEPAGWPQHLSWPRHAPRWLATLERARAFLRGELPDPCGAMHFGGGMDAPRGRMVPAACVGLRNRYWVTR